MDQVFDALSRVRAMTESVIAYFSCGKDSVVCLDLCVKTFKRVDVFFLYTVPGLSFQESYIRYIEHIYGITINRLPHFSIAHNIRRGLYMPHRAHVPARVTISDIDAHIRTLTGLHWIADGSKMVDSLQRRGMMNKCKGVDEARGRFWPLCHYRHSTVHNYLKSHHLMLSPEYGMGNCSWGGSLTEPWLRAIKTKYPEDYEKIEARYPYVGALLHRADSQQVPEILRPDDSARVDQKCAV